MKIHPLCAGSADIPTAEFELLRQDIKDNGQRCTILIWNDQVIDGRHRLRACEEVGHRPRFEDVSLLVVEEDLPAYVRSLNDRRRHQTPAQRIESAMTIEQKPMKSTTPMGEVTSPPPPTVPEIAAKAEVSDRTVQQFKKAKKDGAKEIQQAMMEGQISIDTAAKAAKLPKAHQKRLAEQGIPILAAAVAAEAKLRRNLGAAAYTNAVDEPTVEQLPGWKAEAVKAIESLYDRNKAQWNSPPPPPPRMVIDWVIKIVREL